jgi:hypothetical protein
MGSPRIAREFGLSQADGRKRSRLSDVVYRGKAGVCAVPALLQRPSVIYQVGDHRV